MLNPKKKFIKLALKELKNTLKMKLEKRKKKFKCIQGIIMNPLRVAI